VRLYQKHTSKTKKKKERKKEKERQALLGALCNFQKFNIFCV
jgi:hypothetical protein